MRLLIRDEPAGEFRLGAPLQGVVEMLLKGPLADLGDLGVCRLWRKRIECYGADKEEIANARAHFSNPGQRRLHSYPNFPSDQKGWKMSSVVEDSRDCEPLGRRRPLTGLRSRSETTHLRLVLVCILLATNPAR